MNDARPSSPRIDCEAVEGIVHERHTAVVAGAESASASNVVVPAEPHRYDEDEFATASDRVDAARRRVLGSDAGLGAHDVLRCQIDERVAARKASLP